MKEVTTELWANINVDRVATKTLFNDKRMVTRINGRARNPTRNHKTIKLKKFIREQRIQVRLKTQRVDHTLLQKHPTHIYKIPV